MAETPQEPPLSVVEAGEDEGSVRSANGSCSTHNSSVMSPQHCIRPKAQPMAAMAQPLAPMCGHLGPDEDEDEEYIGIEDEDDEETVGSNSTANNRDEEDAQDENDNDNTNYSSLRHSQHSRSRRRGRPTTKRAIQFLPPNELAMYHDGADIEELAQNRADLWYQYEELKTIKRKALAVSKEAQRVGIGHVLTNTYGKSCQETQEALNVWATVSGAANSTRRQTNGKVINSNSTNASRRGLERWINEEYAAKRSDIRKRTIQSVLRAQAKMKDSALDDPGYASKVLSRLSEAFSIDSKQFARGMGVADALAAKQQEQDDNSSHSHEESAAEEDLSSLQDNSSHHYRRQQDRHAPSRKNSPNSVVVGPNNNDPFSRKKQHPTVRMGKRNLSLTAPSVSADFRHYY